MVWECNGCVATSPIVIGSLAVQALGALLVVKVMGMVSNREWLVKGLVAVEAFLVKVGWGLQWEGYVGSAQLVVIRHMCLKVSPLFRRGGGPQGRGKNVGVAGAGVGGARLEEGVQGGGVVAAGLKGVEEPLPPGRVLSQREQALGALDALIQVLGPEGGVITSEALHLFSEEDRGRCIRPFTVQSEEDLSGLSDEKIQVEQPIVLLP